MFFRDYAVGSVSLLLLAQVDVIDRLGVGISSIDGVTEVHGEILALPAEAGLDVRPKKLAQWRRLAVMTLMEWVDHSLRLGSSMVMFRTTEAQCLR